MNESFGKCRTLTCLSGLSSRVAKGIALSRAIRWMTRPWCTSRTQDKFLYIFFFIYKLQNAKGWKVLIVLFTYFEKWIRSKRFCGRNVYSRDGRRYECLHRLNRLRSLLRWQFSCPHFHTSKTIWHLRFWPRVVASNAAFQTFQLLLNNSSSVLRSDRRGSWRCFLRHSKSLRGTTQSQAD